MKILAIDIGAGTEDILLYDDEKKSVENCVKMVLPSPSQVFSKNVKAITNMRKNLFITGDTIGGGVFAHALRKHVEAGLMALMTKTAAYSIRNDLEEVKKLGIKVVKDQLKEFNGKTLVIEEVNIIELARFLTVFDEPLSDIDFVAIAVQDHGISPQGVSNRRSRIEKTRKLLEKNPKPEALAYYENEIPQHFLRMRSAAQASKRQLPDTEVLLMDTSPDAILGCLKDPLVREADPVLVVNIGNSHTMAAIILNGEITAIMEHHTNLLNPLKIENMLIHFADGKLTNEEIFNDRGHGLTFLTEPPGFSNLGMVVATGPNRNLLTQLKYPVHFASPAGDMMMTGPIGLVEAVKRKSSEK
ncbi:MAG: DUF1786 family protein [Candidatus Bathyarchaeota archaeon]|jgi:uncharacterized protein (DUF1786 family)